MAQAEVNVNLHNQERKGKKKKLVFALAGLSSYLCSVCAVCQFVQARGWYPPHHTIMSTSSNIRTSPMVSCLAARYGPNRYNSMGALCSPASVDVTSNFHSSISMMALLHNRQLKYSGNCAPRFMNACRSSSGAAEYCRTATSNTALKDRIRSLRSSWTASFSLRISEITFSINVDLFSVITSQTGSPPVTRGVFNYRNRQYYNYICSSYASQWIDLTMRTQRFLRVRPTT
jgi:hypothetical protein